MYLQNLPSVDAQFINHQGDKFVVIGRGTGGIVIEYGDGRVELISPQRWQAMNQWPQLKAIH